MCWFEDSDFIGRIEYSQVGWAEGRMNGPVARDPVRQNKNVYRLLIIELRKDGLLIGGYDKEK